MRFIQYWLAFALCMATTMTPAQTEINIPVAHNSTDIPISRYQGADTRLPLFLWLPSHRGTSPKQKITAQTLSDLGFEVWIADLHLAYFVDEGRRSVDQFPDEDIAELIHAAATLSGREVILIAGHRGTKNALGGSRAYQILSQQNHAPLQLVGMVLFSPNITIASAVPGQAASYQAIAQSSNLPIYIIQPSISTSQWRANEAADILRSGGATVYLQGLPGIQSGFHVRPDEDLTEADFDARSELPFTIERAANILVKAPKPNAAAPLILSNDTQAKNRYGIKALRPYPAKLKLPLTTGEQHDISQHKGKVALVSFWASWCEPCIRELPSLKRLHDDFKHLGLDIITVNAGEDAATIEASAKQFNMNDYILMMDQDGAALKAWNVYGFPTNFLVNQSTQVVFGSFGAVEWDEPEARAAVKSLLKSAD